MDGKGLPKCEVCGIRQVCSEDGAYFEPKVLQESNWFAAKMAKLRSIHPQEINQAVVRSPLKPQVKLPPQPVLLLLSSVFAASLDEDPPVPEYPSPHVSLPDSDYVYTIKTLQDLENSLSKAGDKLVVIFCMVRWCPFCRKIAPAVEEMAASRSGDLLMLKLDMDDQEADSAKIVARYKAYYLQQDRVAVGLPTFVFVRGGTKLEHFSSSDDEQLRGAIYKYTA